MILTPEAHAETHCCVVKAAFARCSPHTVDLRVKAGLSAPLPSCWYYGPVLVLGWLGYRHGTLLAGLGAHVHHNPWKQTETYDETEAEKEMEPQM